MLLVVGLGNPGRRYARNRHNIGFMAVDAIARRHDFGPWRDRFQGDLAEGVVAGGKTRLLKPRTYMNESGRSVVQAVRFFRLEPANVVVFHDEIDLVAGKVRVKRGGGHAGHNGLRSLHAHIGPDYARVRLGVDHPGHKDAVIGHVLKDFAKEDREDLNTLLDALAEHFPLLASGDDAAFMSKVAAVVNPPRRPHTAGPPTDGPPTDGL